MWKYGQALGTCYTSHTSSSCCCYFESLLWLLLQITTSATNLVLWLLLLQLLLQLLYCYNINICRFFQPPLCFCCSCHTCHPPLQLLPANPQPFTALFKQPDTSGISFKRNRLLLICPLQVWSNLIYSYLSCFYFYWVSHFYWVSGSLKTSIFTEFRDLSKPFYTEFRKLQNPNYIQRDFSCSLRA